MRNGVERNLGTVLTEQDEKKPKKRIFALEKLFQTEVPQATLLYKHTKGTVHPNSPEENLSPPWVRVE